MLTIPLAFSLFYGLAFNDLAIEQDYAPFDPSSEDLTPFLENGAAFIEENAREHHERGIVRVWLEFLIASSNTDIAALGFDVRGISDIVLPHPGVGALPLSEWHHVLQWMRHRLFDLPPMTDDEKAKVKREVTIIDEGLPEFRARMKAEGRVDPA
jgi:hypothetical protein